MIRCAVAIRRLLGISWGYVPFMLAYMYYSESVTVKELKEVFDISESPAWSIYKSFNKVNEIMPGSVVHPKRQIWTLSDEFRDKIRKEVLDMNYSPTGGEYDKAVTAIADKCNVDEGRILELIDILCDMGFNDGLLMAERIADFVEFENKAATPKWEVEE